MGVSASIQLHQHSTIVVIENPKILLCTPHGTEAVLSPRRIFADSKIVATPPASSFNMLHRKDSASCATAANNPMISTRCSAPLSSTQTAATHSAMSNTNNAPAAPSPLRTVHVPCRFDDPPMPTPLSASSSSSSSSSSAPSNSSDSLLTASSLSLGLLLPPRTSVGLFKAPTHPPSNEWLEKYSVGIEEVDQHHWKMFELIAEHNHNNSGNIATDSETIRSVLNDFDAYATTHFQLEESLMAEVDYPQIAEHIRAHKTIFEAVHKSTTSLMSGSSTSLAKLHGFLSSWLPNHILKMDRPFAQYYINYQQMNAIRLFSQQCHHHHYPSASNQEKAP